MSAKVVFVDLDGTLCTEEKAFERPLARPLPGAKDALDRIYDAGHTVVVWTARGWEQYRVTQDWLDRLLEPRDKFRR